MRMTIREAAMGEKEMVALAEAALDDIQRVRKSVGRVIFAAKATERPR